MQHCITDCDCSPYGSVRSDCDQTSGKCICKPGIQGAKCDICPDGTTIREMGCDGRKYKLHFLSIQICSDLIFMPI